MDDFYRYPHGLETSKCWYMSWGTPIWYGFTCLREWDIIWTEADMMGNRSNNISIRLGLGTLNWSVPNHQPWTKPSKFGVRFSWTISMYYTSIVYLLVPTHWIRPRMQHNFVLGWFPYIPIYSSKTCANDKGAMRQPLRWMGNSMIFLFFYFTDFTASPVTSCQDAGMFPMRWWWSSPLSAAQELGPASRFKCDHIVDSKCVLSSF